MYICDDVIASFLQQAVDQNDAKTFIISTLIIMDNKICIYVNERLELAHFYKFIYLYKRAYY